MFARTKEVLAEGTEAIDGVPCTRKVVSGMGQVFAVAWVSEEFGFPLKVQTTLPERIMELSKVARGLQDASFFTVLADWTRVEPSNGPEPPEWTGQVAGAPVLTPPFETIASPSLVPSSRARRTSPRRWCATGTR